MLIEDRFPIEEIKSAVGQLKEQGKEPLPSRINKLLSVSADIQFLPEQWWETEASTMSAAKNLGLVARPRELMPEFRQRIRAEA